jgi:DNA-binding winged helix-turn-helix (wHTH) protein/tetratricopeptide (TPR) repeat protein
VFTPGRFSVWSAISADMIRLSAADVDLARGHVRRHTGDEVRLTSTERALLAYLVRHVDTDLSRETLLTEVWGYAPGVASRALDTAVKTLRRKLGEDPRAPAHLLTVRGVGYRFVLPSAALDDGLVGRGALRKRLREVWADGARLVTLVGPGGVGKSHLASVVAETVGGAVRVALADARDRAGVETRLALALGAQWQASPCAVLVLDDAEHLRSALRDVLDALWTQRPDQQVWVTSRSPLGIADEVVLEVEPLAPGPARVLLEQRLEAEGAAGSGFREPDVLDALVEALEGLPLAIELAASRARVLDPATLLERIAEPGVLARRGGRSRHRSAEAIVQGSWGLLEPDDRRALARLALFVRPFTVADAEAVLAPGQPGEVLDRLDALVGSSLVRRDGDRLSLLSVVARFARSKGPADGPVVERHAAWALARHARLDASGRLAHGPELVAAIERSIPDVLWVRIALVLVELYRRTGPYDEVLRLVERAQALAMRLDDHGLRAMAAIALAEGRSSAGHPDAQSSCWRALAHALRAPAPERDGLVARGLHVVGAVLRTAGGHDAARVAFEEAVPLASSPVRRAALLLDLALLERLSGHPDRARGHLEDGITALLASSEWPLAAQAMLRLASTERALGRLGPARRWLESARELSEREQVPWTQLAALGALAELDLDAGDAASIQRAVERLDDVELLLVRSRAPRFFACLLPSLRALAWLERGDPLAAAEAAALAVEEVRDRGVPEAAVAWIAHAVVAAVSVGPRVAIERFEHAARVAEATAQGRHQVIALAYLAVLEPRPTALDEAATRAEALSDAVATAIVAVARGEPPSVDAGAHGRWIYKLSQSTNVTS